MDTTIERPETDQKSVLPLSRIHVKFGHNPRNYFSPTAHAEFVESIREKGILQPILVRPIEDGFQVVAGERRYRGAMEAHGEDFLMPVLIREMSDEEADVFAMVENTQRENMSPTEEAVQANKVLIRNKGDRDEVARLFGWSRSTLDKRLALLACVPSVRQALDERRIQLGHAELLAGLVQDKQPVFLDAIITRGLSVTDVKKAIEQNAAKMQTAIFDTAGCVNCPHNSTAQATMFTDTVAGGCCTNPTCYGEKTENHIQGLKTSLVDEYPTIKIFRAGDNGTTVTLKAEGEKGVGAEQFQACHACANFGAAVSALPDSMGKVTKGLCFDTACNSKKIAERIKADQAAAKAAEVAAKQPATGKAVAVTAAKPAPAEKVVTTVSENDRIKSYREGVWRKAMAKEIHANPTLSPQYLIALCLTGDARQISETKLKGYYKQLGGKEHGGYDLGEVAAAVIDSDSNVQDGMLILLALSAMDTLEVRKVQQLATYHKLDLTKHWKMEKGLLDLMTKAEIKVIAQEVKLDVALGAEFNKAFSEKKDDLIKKLLGVAEFDYSATIPKVMQY